MRRIGLDWGTKRIGVAVSDELGLMAHPADTLPVKSKEQSIRSVIELIRRYHPCEVVVGLPLNMNGTEGPSAQAARRFGEDLHALSGCPVTFSDERLTSFEAECLLRDKPAKQRRRRRQTVDKTAACLILQTHLDRLRAQTAAPPPSEAS
ncbi:MAG TPA: Holliday junction resolvase RuvX [Elusimicrobiota bacterium]|nr:Holliday junction resolvase RuvX [Elusimicrobiota bacterium]